LISIGLIFSRSLISQAQVRPLVDPDWSNPATRGTWRGMIGTGFTAQQWDAWFVSYTEYILHFARLSTAINADEFSVGGIRFF
jgi:hypothetical protein